MALYSTCRGRSSTSKLHHSPRGSLYGPDLDRQTKMTKRPGEWEAGGGQRGGAAGRGAAGPNHSAGSGLPCLPADLGEPVGNGTSASWTSREPAAATSRRSARVGCGVRCWTQTMSSVRPFGRGSSALSGLLFRRTGSALYTWMEEVVLHCTHGWRKGHCAHGWGKTGSALCTWMKKGALCTWMEEVVLH